MVNVLRQFRKTDRRADAALVYPAGFNAKRDIAGIVLNRWGHALFSPPPGFYFGKEGKPAPLAVLGQPFGRIAFDHSELSGYRYQTWDGATFAGKRALLQII